MSGIAGIINFDNAPLPASQVTLMTDSMHYRGPDGINHWFSETAGFGHCMLHTTPESLEEYQPVTSEDGDLVLLMDGRIDNWIELRKDLRSRNLVLRNRSDAELVLRAFQHWGPDCLDHMEGDYALTIWNSRTRRLFCARDPLGIKPFHYHWNGRSLYFASDVSALLALTNIPREPNLPVIAECLSAEWHSLDETFWKGVYMLPAAHHLWVTAAGPQRTRYWTPDLWRTLDYKRDTDYFEHYRELLADTVRRFSRSHKPVACDVSGGLDSSAIFAVADQLERTGRLPAPGMAGYTLNFGGYRDADEIEFARAVSAHLKRPVAEIEPAFPAFSSYAKAARQYRDLPGYPNLMMADNELTAISNSGSRVRLDGLGGDEWLCDGGYYYQDELRSGHFSQVVRILASQTTADGLLTAARSLLRSTAVLALPDAILAIARRLRNSFDQQQTGRRWLSPVLRQALADSASRSSMPSPVTPRLPGQQAFLGILTDAYIARNHLITERYAASFGIESRRPYYYRPMVQFAFMLPRRLMWHDGMGKYTHRQALQGLLPEPVRLRETKSEFSVMFEHYLPETKGLLNDHLLSSRDSWIDAAGLRSLRHQLQSDEPEELPVWLLWSLYACDNIFDN